MADRTLYDTTVPSQGSVALAHQRIIRIKVGGVFVNITGDVNNLLDTPTPIKVAREVYGTKGVKSSDIIGYDHVITFDVEAVRDTNGAIVQSWLILLLNKAADIGFANKAEFQTFDALDDNVPSFQGTYSVSQVPANVGYADKLVFKFTLENDGPVAKITSPIAGSSVPIIESVSPTGLTVGDQVILRGYKLSTVTAITIDAQNVVEFVKVDANTIVFVIPASVAGAAAVIATSPSGASTAFAYTAA